MEKNLIPLKDSVWKSRVDLIIPDFLLEMWDILRLWAEKYRENSWQWIPIKEHYWAALRHLFKFFLWEKNDQETWKSHLVHAACNIMFMFHNSKENLSFKHKRIDA